MPNEVSAAQLSGAEPAGPAAGTSGIPSKSAVPDESGATTPAPLPGHHPWIHRFAIATAIATYLLILIGGLVHGTGSSLACPDWPTCYGTFMPKMEGGVLVEHSHRLAAGTVVILTLVLAGLLTATRDPALRRLRPFGWLAVGLVFAQALLGGITVLLRLPTPISTAHTATSLLFFLTVLYIAVRSRPRWPGPPRRRSSRGWRS